MTGKLTEQQRARFSGAIDRLAGDEEMFLEVAEVAIEDIPAMIERTNSAIGQPDSEDAAAAVHKLKGLLSTFVNPDSDLEFDTLMGALSQEESAADPVNEWESLKPQIDNLISEIEGLPTR